jgi:hypothetical protein
VWPAGADGDQQRLAGRGRTLELEGLAHVEPPVTAQGAVDVVDGREAAVIEVQPQVALQAEAVVVGIAQAAAALDHRELRIRGHAKRRETLPVVRHVGLQRVDAFGSFGRGDPQAVGGLEAPDLLARPGPLRIRALQRILDPVAARQQLDLVRAGAHLHAQVAVALDARRHVAGEAQRREAIGQHAAEQFLARLAGDVQPDTRQ